MKLKVIGTGSKGNAYLLENDEEALLIECGVPFNDIKAALDFNVKKLVGCILTHEHGDHAKSVKQVMAAGINVFSREGTHAALNTTMNHRAAMIPKGPTIFIGKFKIISFDVKHDAAEPCGFLINHSETGNVLFMTDLVYSKYTFKNLHNIIIEANYHQPIARRNLSDMEFLRNRIINSHMSLDTCVNALKANDLRQANNIVLIHLSDGNSDESLFRRTVTKSTGKNVTVADNGLVMEFNKTPF